MFTRQHFEKIADVIKCARPAEGQPQQWRAGCDSAREYIANQLCNEFKASNPNFKRGLFLRACGLES